MGTSGHRVAQGLETSRRRSAAGRHRRPQSGMAGGVFGNGADSAAVVTAITRNADPEGRTIERIAATAPWRRAAQASGKHRPVARDPDIRAICSESGRCVRYWRVFIEFLLLMSAKRAVFHNNTGSLTEFICAGFLRWQVKLPLRHPVPGADRDRMVLAVFILSFGGS